MAIKVNGTTVIDNNGNLTNVGSLNISGVGDFSNSTSALKLPTGTAGDRPEAPIAGELRFNNDENALEQYDGNNWASVRSLNRATLDRSFTSGESVSISLNSSLSVVPSVSVTKEVPQIGLTNSDWDVAADGSNFTLHDTAYDTTLTPSNATGSGTFTLGAGSFAAEDVGKRIVGNGGVAFLTATDGSYNIDTAFNDTSTVAAGDWSMFGLDVESADLGLTLSTTTQFAPSNITKNYSEFPYFFYNEIDVGIKMVSSDTGTVVDTQQFINTGSNAASAAVGIQTGRLYIGVNNAGIEAFDVDYTNGTLSNSWSNNAGNAYGVALNSSETKLYVANFENNTLEVYDPDTGNFLSNLKTFSSIANTVQPFVDVNENIYVPKNDGVEKIDSTGSTLWSVSSTSTCSNLTIDIYNNVILFASDIYVIDSSSGNLLRSVSVNSGIQGGSTDSNGNIIALSGNNNISKYDNNLNLLWSLDVKAQTGDTTVSGYEILVDHNDNIYFVGNGGDAKIDPDGNIVWNNNNSGNLANNCAAAMWYNQNTYYTTGRLTNIFSVDKNHTAITSTSTNTEFWTDINSMTADDASNDGAVYYAVSTDGRATWSIIDDTNGIRNIVRNNSGTWEVNDASDYGTETWVAATENDEFSALEEAVELSTAQVLTGFSLENASYDNVSFDISSQSTTPTSVTFNNDGTKMYAVGGSDTSVYQYTLSTAFDLSTASYDSVSLDVSSQDGFPTSVTFNNDGAKMYILGGSSDSVYQYSLSTSFDLDTASYDNISFDVSGQGSSPSGIIFNNNGTKMYRVGNNTSTVHQYTLGASFDLSSASYDNVSFDVSNQDGGPQSITFNTDGTKMYMAGIGTDSVYQYTLSTAFDLSTTNYDNVSFDVSQGSQPNGITFNNDGTKMYMVDRSTDFIYQYSTGSTTSTNRMDATQLNAVSDANHYTLGNDLDLAITLFMADGNTNPPTSDGVSINYDGNINNVPAVLGVDYEFDFVGQNNIVLKSLSNSNENYKIRVT